MNDTDWSDFVDRLSKYDPDYSPGQFADLGDLIDCILSLAQAAATQCVIHFQETLILRNCPGGYYKEKTVSEQLGLTIHNPSDEPLAQQILNPFHPESVSDFSCAKCQMLVTSANKSQHPRSYQQILRVNITAPRADRALPGDFHKHQL